MTSHFNPDFNHDENEHSWYVTIFWLTYLFLIIIGFHSLWEWINA